MIKLYGASGHCKVIIDIIINNGLLLEKIYDDNLEINQLLNYPVSHSSKIEINDNDSFIIAIGNNKIRKKICEKFNFKFATAIHSHTIISKTSSVDQGTVVMPGTIINANTKIGKHCIVNTASVIEHDCIIDDFAHICPNATLAGGVVIGEGAQVGIGAKIIQGIKIGKWATIGAGAVVLEDVPDFSVVVGNPGKIIKYQK